MTTAMDCKRKECAFGSWFNLVLGWSGAADQRRPASRAYERGHVVDWSREPYARGAYTYPSLGAHVNDR